MRSVIRAAAVGLALALCIAAIAAPEGEPQMRQPSVFESVIAARPLDVWQVLTTADGWAQMGWKRARIELRPGGSLHLPDAGVAASGATTGTVRPVLAVEPGVMLALGDPRDAGSARESCRWWTVIRLRDLGDGRTRVTQSHFHTPAEAAADAGAERVPSPPTEPECEAVKLARVFAASSASAPDADAASLEFSEWIPAPPASVFRAWTTQEGVQTFFSEHARVRLERGGPYEILFDTSKPQGQQGSEGCTVLSWLPGRMLSFTWNAPPHFAHARGRHTWVVVEFEPEGGGTRLRLTHMGWSERIATEREHADEWRKVRAYFAAAWPMVLTAARESIRATEATPR